jgi:[ribosomal protein S18]-alanine N-acetyltransferase
VSANAAEQIHQAVDNPAWLAPGPVQAQIVPMGAVHLPAVVHIERDGYLWPWSEGNFRDSMSQGHHCQVLLQGSQVLGYFVAMPGVQEVHLLNITVAKASQGQGWAWVMLDVLTAWAKSTRADWIWLEVRQSNERALQIYERAGFRRVSVRKAYYPLDGTTREDAIVMSLNLCAT